MRATRRTVTSAPRHRLPSVIVLAAGASSRFGGTKQLTSVGGKNLVERALDAVPAEETKETVLVLGHEAEAVAESVGSRRGVRVVVNSEFRDGMSTSIRAGVAALAKDAPAAMLVLADQPFVTRALLRRLLRVFKEDGRDEAIAAAAYGGLVAPPVIFSRGYFRELQGLQGDSGAKAVIAAHPDRVSMVRVRSKHALADIDTPQDLDEARQLLEP
jgi:molybdenum cofactor cytidylyltransferase